MKKITNIIFNLNFVYYFKVSHYIPTSSVNIMTNQERMRKGCEDNPTYTCKEVQCSHDRKVIKTHWLLINPGFDLGCDLSDRERY